MPGRVLLSSVAAAAGAQAPAQTTLGGAADGACSYGIPVAGFIGGGAGGLHLLPVPRKLGPALLIRCNCLNLTSTKTPQQPHHGMALLFLGNTRHPGLSRLRAMAALQ